MKFKKITTGTYSYYNKSNKKFTSHCIYALDEEGNVYKWIGNIKKWIRIEDVEIHSQSYGVE